MFLRTLAAVIVLGLALPGASDSQPWFRQPAPLLGVHDQAACASNHRKGIENTRQFAQWLGRRPDLVMDFAWWNSWSDILRSSSLLPSCWRSEGYRNLAFSVPLLPNDHVSTLEQGAAGAYDNYFLQIAQALIANGYGHAIIRLGWEFNLPNYPWAAAKNPQAWVAYFQRVVGVMRSAPGAEFRFDWNPAVDGAYARPGHIAPPLVYPGDQFVDIIGLDVYNQWWGDPSVPPEQRWEALAHQPYGLEWHRDFAAQHGKPMSFPEWGTGTRPDGHGGGDDDYFVTQMASWILANNVAYHDYWDEQAPDYNAQLSNGQFPRAGAAFRRTFGGGGEEQGWRERERDQGDSRDEH